jgi:hypothetical protein
MAKSLKGTWVYSLQGVMQAQNLDNRNVEKPRGVVVNRGGRVAASAGFRGLVLPPTFPTLAMETVPGPHNPIRTDENGYLPATELGQMHCEPIPNSKGNGKVEGTLRLNVAGLADAAEYEAFRGLYRLGTHQGVTVGAITIQFTRLPKLVWDYSLVFVSDHEVLLASGGRVPRPGVLHGIMRRPT